MPVALPPVGAAPSDIELAFYDEFFIAKGIEPYPVQERALGHIFAGASLLVTVPTGTGKTLMAKAALYRALARNETAIYTTPLRALTEEKFRELSEDFGPERVGFATGDYKVNPEAPIQVVVAEILWNRIFGQRGRPPAHVVVMDEGHYFNDPERGYVWEQSIIGLDAGAQLVVLSATIGNPEEFCQWAYLVRRSPMELVQSTERRVPLVHEYRETTLVELVKELYAQGDYPTIVFGFAREQCFERARLLRSCPRFTSDEERVQIAERARTALLGRGAAAELEPLLLHGIGIHHAGILPRYKQLVEELCGARLVKFVLSTETISAGINLPAKVVVFPELRKALRGQARLLVPAEYHQMAGRAGRPQFDTEGLCITLAPEDVVLDMRKEVRELERARRSVDLERIRKTVYGRARSEAQKRGGLVWDAQAHAALVAGKPAGLRSHTQITAEQILAIGLPVRIAPEGTPGLPASYDLDAGTLVGHLLLPDRERTLARKRLAAVIANLEALGLLGPEGEPVGAQMIAELRGVDALFVSYCLSHHDFDYERHRQLLEYLIEEQGISKLLGRKDDEKRRQWILERLRERRREQPQTAWEDVEEEYDKAFPRELTEVERVHSEFLAALPHPELHGGKVAKRIFADIESRSLSFFDFVEEHGLAHQEGLLFSYLARLRRTAKMLAEATTLPEYRALEEALIKLLEVVDERVSERG